MRIGMNLSAQSAAAVSLAATADVFTFTPSQPIRLIRFGYRVTTLLDNTPTPVKLALDTNDVIAVPVRTERAVLTAAVVDEVIGEVTYRDIPEFTMFTGLDKNVIIPGVQAILEVTQAATAGAGFAFIEYTPLSWETCKQVGSSHVHYPQLRTS